jgi:hypothetical protein
VLVLYVWYAAVCDRRQGGEEEEVTGRWQWWWMWIWEDGRRGRQGD